jgi:hypothetical protein
MICKKCQQDKDLSCFYVRRENGRYRSECKACHSERTVKWQSKNRDKVRSYIRKSCKTAYDRDPDKYRLKSKQRREAFPEKVRLSVNSSYKKVYAVRHPQERARLNAASAARRRASPLWLNAIERAQIREFYDIAKCLSVQTGVKHHVDHIMPIKGLTSSGLHVPWNLQILTASENCAKKNKVI